MVPEGLFENLGETAFGYAPDVSRRSRADCTKARENNIKHKEAKATVHTLYCCCVCTYRAVGRSGNPEGMTSIVFLVLILLNEIQRFVFCNKFAIFDQFSHVFSPKLDNFV